MFTHASEASESTAENANKLKAIVEALLFASNKSLTIDNLVDLLAEDIAPSRQDLRDVIALLTHEYYHRAVQLVELAGSYRFQTRAIYSQWVQRLWEETPQKYSRALLETLSLIAYRQPITRGDIEEVRGVAVSSTIIKTLQERQWIKVIGHREVPGRPAIYATTKDFLKYFNLKSLDLLPTLSEIRDIDLISKEVNAQLELVPSDAENGKGADFNEELSHPSRVGD